MSILRYELPRPLDVHYLIETISNPNLLTSSLGIPLTVSNPPGSTHHVPTSFNLPRPPPLLSSQTNDGTLCLHYPNGQQAILLANVHGYYIESSGSNSNSAYIDVSAKNAAPGGPTSITNSFISNSYGMNMLWQNVNNSYTTVVYDIARFNKASATTKSSNVTGLVSKLTMETDKSHETNTLTGTYSLAKSTHQVRKKVTTIVSKTILATISPLGHCVVYRRDGTPR